MTKEHRELKVIRKCATHCEAAEQTYRGQTSIFVVPRSRGRLPITEEAFCTASILAYLQPSEKFIVDIDASNVGIG
jgi:hypothetical protein